MTGKLTRAEVLRKCIIVMDALKRVTSKGNAGLEPMEGAEESFWTDTQICDTLREMLRELESGIGKQIVRDWQKDLMENGLPERMTL